MAGLGVFYNYAISRAPVSDNLLVLLMSRISAVMRYSLQGCEWCDGRESADNRCLLR